MVGVVECLLVVVVEYVGDCFVWYKLYYCVYGC